MRSLLFLTLHPALLLGQHGAVIIDVNDLRGKSDPVMGVKKKAVRRQLF
jgi:hypothetical protein